MFLEAGIKFKIGQDKNGSRGGEMYMERRDHTHIKAQREGKERDGYICQICGSHDHVEGHHLIDYQYGGASASDNIITLCKECHQEVHRGHIDIIKF